MEVWRIWLTYVCFPITQWWIFTRCCNLCQRLSVLKLFTCLENTNYTQLHTSCITRTMVQSSWYNTKVPLFYDSDFSDQKWITNDGTASRYPSTSRDIQNNNTVRISHIYIYIYIYKYNIQSIPNDRDKRVWKTLQDLKFSWWGVYLLLSLILKMHVIYSSDALASPD